MKQKYSVEEPGSPFSSFCPVLGCPVQAVGFNSDFSFGHGPFVAVQNVRGEADDVLTLVVVDKTQVLKCGDHVFFPNTRHLGYIAAIMETFGPQFQVITRTSWRIYRLRAVSTFSPEKDKKSETHYFIGR